MNNNKRQSFLNLIENAAMLEGRNILWVDFPYHKRLVAPDKEVKSYERKQPRNAHS
jgi:hypothetical protein